MTGAQPSLLFDVPDYALTCKRFFERALLALAVAKGPPFLANIVDDPVEAVPDVVNTTPDGGTIQTPASTVVADFSLSRSAGIAGDFDDLFIALDVASEAYGRDLTRQILENITSLSNAFGTAVSGEGKDFATTLLEALERLEWPLDDEGKVQVPTLLTHPDTAAKIGQATPPDWFGPAFERLQARKQAEADARRRTRRLPRQR